MTPVVELWLTGGRAECFSKIHPEEITPVIWCSHMVASVPLQGQHGFLLCAKCSAHKSQILILALLLVFGVILCRQFTVSISVIPSAKWR